MASAVAAAALLPMASFAQTTNTNAQAQVQALLTQILALQAQLKTLVQQNGGTGGWHGSSTPPTDGGWGHNGGGPVPSGGGWGQQIGPSTGIGQSGMMSPGGMAKMACVTLTHDLHVGSQGDDVRKVQDMLASNPQFGFTGSTTGFFGPKTAQAMMHFQMSMGIASSSNGSVGPLTRGFFDRSCGMGMGHEMGSSTRSHMDGSEGMPQGGHADGAITANSGGTLSVNDRSGVSRKVIVGANTTIMIWNGTTTAPTIGTAGSLAVGLVIMAEGPVNADGSIQAAHIKVGFPKPPAPPQGQ